MTMKTIAGELESTPLAHFLVYAIDRRLTGALFLDEPSGMQHVVSFSRGAPVKVRPGDGYALLGQLLVDAGAITEGTLEGALSMRGLLGDALLVGGCVDLDTLESVATAQFIKRMVRLFGCPPATKLTYIEGHAELDEWGGKPASVDPLALLWAGLREHAGCSTMMEGTLARLGDTPVRVHPAAVLDRFDFAPQELSAVTQLLDLSPPLSDLIASGVAPAETLRRLVYMLFITRHLDLGHDTMPVGVVEEPVPSAAYMSSSMGFALGRVQLRTVAHRVGAAAPDPPGDGEPSISSSRTRR